MKYFKNAGRARWMIAIAVSAMATVCIGQSHMNECGSACMDLVFGYPTYSDGTCTGTADWCEAGYASPGSNCSDHITPRRAECYESCDLVALGCTSNGFDYGGKHYSKMPNSNNGQGVCCFCADFPLITSSQTHG